MRYRSLCMMPPWFHSHALVIFSCDYYNQTLNFFVLKIACKDYHHLLRTYTSGPFFFLLELYFLVADDETLLYYCTGDSLLAFRLKISSAKKYCSHCKYYTYTGVYCIITISYICLT
jgi:hypothetical protein